jgi:hypothetical protein
MQQHLKGKLSDVLRKLIAEADPQSEKPLLLIQAINEQ